MPTLAFARVGSGAPCGTHGVPRAAIARRERSNAMQGAEALAAYIYIQMTTEVQ